jgi:hypothetical protein
MALREADAVLLGVGFSGGVLFGLLPALQAATLRPIAAPRYA